jgi:hypothetical protein
VAEDLSAQLAACLPKLNARLVRRSGARPMELLPQGKAAKLGLPPVPPFPTPAAAESAGCATWRTVMARFDSSKMPA